MHDKIFTYKEHSTLLPLVGLTIGQVGKAIEHGIRSTLFCAKTYPLMVKFYNLVLEADPVNMKNYVIFSLTTEPTSILELCIYDSPSISTHLLDHISLHFFVSDLLTLVSQLLKEFKCDFSHLGKGLWRQAIPVEIRLLFMTGELSLWCVTWVAPLQSMNFCVAFFIVFLLNLCIFNQWRSQYALLMCNLMWCHKSRVKL